MNTALNGIAALPHVGVIQVQGEDAASFLHGQLTQDFALLGMSEARLCAFCSPKGRMLASFIGFKRGPQDILLVCSRDILAATLKRLSMFVMRAKAKLADASDAFSVRGLAGATLEQLAGPPLPVWSKLDLAPATVVFLYPADGVTRALWVAPIDSAVPPGPLLDTAAWQLSEVHSGIATVSAPVSEAFVPQMLNYESVGGVNFKKGCYPGQEVVARSQYRGTLKRRAFMAHAQAPMTAGEEIFQADDPDQPCATVVQAAPSPTGGFDAIVSGQIAALQKPGLHLGSAIGPDVEIRQMPYALLEEV
ncbi:MAG: folate-binding protein [Burkholderiaceae bacterium]